jgi:peptide/nickel transport system ATP-binding protein
VSTVLLEAHGLRRIYDARGLVRRGTTIAAVDGVSLAIEKGQCHAMVGESGSGKSTLIRLLLALERPTEGRVLFDGHTISNMTDEALRPLRRRFQAVFQDPTGSLNSRLRIATIVSEPLAANHMGNATERQRRVAEVLDEVGLPAAAADRYPSAFSTGERQRIAIARALAPEPDLLLLDEPVAALDASVQGRVLYLIDRLRHDHGLTVVLVSHDLGVVRDVCDNVSVMYRGIVVESGPTPEVLASPAHPYTRALLAASPVPDPAWRPPEPIPVSDPPWLTTTACRYAPRCALRQERCAEEPELVPIGDNRRAACWVER